MSYSVRLRPTGSPAPGWSAATSTPTSRSCTSTPTRSVTTSTSPEGRSFDTRGADYTYRGPRRTFEVLIDEHDLGGDPALIRPLEWGMSTTPSMPSVGNRKAPAQSLTVRHGHQHATPPSPFFRCAPTTKSARQSASASPAHTYLGARRHEGFWSGRFAGFSDLRFATQRPSRRTTPSSTACNDRDPICASRRSAAA